MRNFPWAATELLRGDPIPLPVETTGFHPTQFGTAGHQKQAGCSPTGETVLEVSALVLRNATQRRRHQRWGGAHARPGEIHRTLLSSEEFPHAPAAHPPFGGMSGRSADPLEGPARLPRAAMWSRIDTEPTTTLGARVALFTLLTSSTMFLRIGRADDSVWVATGGWMLVDDLRWDMTAEWQRPTHSQLNG
jgi:hypothetical protein